MKKRVFPDWSWKGSFQGGGGPRRRRGGAVLCPLLGVTFHFPGFSPSDTYTGSLSGKYSDLHIHTHGLLPERDSKEPKHRDCRFRDRKHVPESKPVLNRSMSLLCFFCLRLSWRMGVRAWEGDQGGLLFLFLTRDNRIFSVCGLLRSL